MNILSVVKTAADRVVLCSALGLFCLSACTSEQAYHSGQGYQRNQCAKIPDRNEYERCMEQSSKSYDDYRKETDALKK